MILYADDKYQDALFETIGSDNRYAMTIAITSIFLVILLIIILYGRNLKIS